MPNDVTVDLGNAYIGSAYSPQVAITDTEDGHEVTFTFADSEHPGQLTTASYDVPNYASEEAGRESAEQARVAAESARAAAEQARAAAESARASAETGRVNAESDREDAEAARASAEQARAAAETARASAEGSRASAEQARTSAESARASAEAGRATAESARVSAEQARATAESARAAAESARVTAEQARQTDTAAAIARADAATSAANTATSNANAATTAAQAATGKAETATDAANAAAALATAAAETVTDAYFPDLTAGAAEGITGGGPTDTAAWTYRACPGTDGPATIESIHGRTVVWNQLVGSDTASVTVPSGHKYVSYIETTVDDATTTVKTLATSDGTAIATTGGTDCVFDLTRMFGAGNEPSTVAEFEALYPEPYYEYDAGSLLSVQMEGIESADADGNVLTSRAIPAATYFPNGMRSAGSVYDELTATERITRIGEWVLDSQYATRVDSSTDYIEVVFTVPNIPYPLDAVATHFVSDFTEQVIADRIVGMKVGNNTAWYWRIPTAKQAATGTTLEQVKAYIDAHTLTVDYALATPTTTPIDPSLNLSYKASDFGTERIMVPANEQSAPPTLVVTYGSTADGIRDRALSAIAPVENGRASANYGVGTYLIHAGQLYRVTTAIASGEAITIGTNVTATTVMAEVLALVQ